MENQPTEFRERLLNAQTVTPMLRDEYQKELDALLNHRLTPRTRMLAIAVIVASVGAAALCVRALFVHYAKQDVRFIAPTYAAVFLAMAGWLAHAVWKGGFSRRSSFAAVENLGGIFAGVFVAVTLFRGMQAPADPNSVFGGIMAILLVMIGFAWGTGNRIAAAKLETREHLLRLESRLADLAERLGK